MIVDAACDFLQKQGRVSGGGTLAIIMLVYRVKILEINAGI